MIKFKLLPSLKTIFPSIYYVCAAVRSGSARFDPKLKASSKWSSKWALKKFRPGPFFEWAWAGLGLILFGPMWAGFG